jgi:hypothetical protein
MVQYGLQHAATGGASPGQTPGEICERMLDLAKTKLPRQHSMAIKGRGGSSVCGSPKTTSRSTLGMMLVGNEISNLCVGGPAFNCQLLEPGDVIVGGELPPLAFAADR